MDYAVLADELLNLRGSRPQVRFDRQLAKAMKGDFFVLHYLQTHGNRAHPKNLSDEMVVSTARIAVILNHLEQEKLIQRLPDTKDNRQIIVTLSEKGMKLLEQHRQKLICYLVKVLEKMGEEDAREYIRLQRKLMCVLADG